MRKFYYPDNLTAVKLYKYWTITDLFVMVSIFAFSIIMFFCHCIFGFFIAFSACIRIFVCPLCGLFSNQIICAVHKVLVY